MNRSSSSRSSGPTKRQRGAMLGPLLQRYFCDYLINQRQLSLQTIAAYRDAFKLLLRFVEQAADKPCDNLTIDDIDAPQVLEFLTDLEKRRGNLARSRNARLAAIRSFFRYAASTDPLILHVAQRVLAIPSKRFDRPTIGHLTRAQMQLILQAPNPSTAPGARDQVLLLLMYNTGARVSEIAGLRVKDLQFGGAGTAKLHLYGKGRKQRTVPLWRNTTRLLRNGLHERQTHSPDDPLMPNAQGRPMTRSGITSRLRVAVEIAAKHDPSLAKRTISPHTIRHTTAMHLLQSNVDLNMIRSWLGHASIETTNTYVEIDLEMKARALEKCNTPDAKKPTPASDGTLMAFLRAI